MTDAFSITVVGAGAIGSAVAFSLVRAGFPAKLVARRDALAAIRRDGLRVDKWDGGGMVRLEVTDDPAELGPQDLVIGTMKAQDWPAGLATLTPLIGRQTALLPPINGVPWWYFDGQGGPRGTADRRCRSRRHIARDAARSNSDRLRGLYGRHARRTWRRAVDQRQQIRSR